MRRQKLMIKKAELNEQRLLFIVTALRTLLRDRPRAPTSTSSSIREKQGLLRGSPPRSSPC